LYFVIEYVLKVIDPTLVVKELIAPTLTSFYSFLLFPMRQFK